MTPRERILCVLNGGIPDRVPISPFVQEEYLSYYFKKKDTDRLTDAIVLADELGFDLITKQYILAAPYFMLSSALNWDLDIKTEVRGGNYYKTTTIQTPEGTLTQVEGAPYNEDILSGIHFSTIQYLIKSQEDFDLFKKYLPEMSDAAKRDIIDAGKFAKQAIGQRGVNCPWAVGSVYNLASTYMNVQDMMVDALTDHEYYNEYMSLFTDITVDSYTLFGESEFDCVGIQGNIANGAMFGADLFDSYVLPYERKAIDVLIDAGKPTVYHNCGNAKNLYPCYKKLGITMWETVSAPPQGDNDLRHAKEYFGDSLVLSGNFDQVNFLKTATPAEIYAKAQEIMEIGKPGGHFVFAASDYLEIGTSVENVKAMLEGARSMAKY